MSSVGIPGATLRQRARAGLGVWSVTLGSFVVTVGEGRQQLRGGVPVVVDRPAERGPAEAVVAQVGIGAAVEQYADDLDLALAGGGVQRGLPRLLAGNVAASEAVGVDAELEQQANR